MVVSSEFVALFIIASVISLVLVDGKPTKGYSEDALNDKYRFLLQRRIDEQGVFKNPKVLSVDDSHQIVNDYIDEIEDTSPNSTAQEPSSSKPLLPICANQYGAPFPGFVCPLMTILDTDYKLWRREMSGNFTDSVQKMMNLSLHPCDHNTSSCVIMALPDNHVLFGCVNDKTGELVAPKDCNAVGKERDEKYVFDFRIPNPISVNKKCESTNDGTPICVRNNLFYKGKMIVQDVGCCCKGDFCADVLFDQSGFNPLPFIRVEMDLDPDQNVNRTPEAVFTNLLHDYSLPDRAKQPQGTTKSNHNRIVLILVLCAFVIGIILVCLACMNWTTVITIREIRNEANRAEDPIDVVFD